VQVIHIISSLRRGGRERQLAGILKSNNTLGNSKAIVFNKSFNSYEPEYDLSSKLIYLKSKNALLRFVEIIRILKTEKPAIVWSWGGMEATYALLLSLITPVKHINGSIRHGIVLLNRKQIWRNIILHLSRYIVANSKAGLLANNLKRGFVLYNGLDDQFLTALRPTSLNLRKEYNIRNDAIIFISVANLLPYKDYTTVLQALYTLKVAGISLMYFIIGEGSERQIIEGKIKELNLQKNVILLGRLTNVKAHLINSDIFIHSSRGEGCSNAIIEAMAVGLPVIASDTGGTKEIINDTFGRLFEYKNSVQLSQYLLDLVNDKEQLIRMGINANKYAINNFSMDIMMRKYTQILKEIV
jgi:glycosyltransferase involved in cell wall biosynthesis